MAKNKMNLEQPPGPSAASVRSILGYSRALRVVDAPPIGKVDIVLN
ncbi:MAG: hypothetical protein KDC00_03950 [Flavobacteriales bacterium]|nr:hypothetical protein [Flavobacteriales bacterium]